MENKDIKQVFQEMHEQPHRIQEIFEANKEILLNARFSSNPFNNKYLDPYLLPENQFLNNQLSLKSHLQYEQKMELEILKQNFKNGNNFKIFNNISKDEQEKIINFLKENSVNEEILSRIQKNFDNENNSKINSKPKLK